MVEFFYLIIGVYYLTSSGSSLSCNMIESVILMHLFISAVLCIITAHTVINKKKGLLVIGWHGYIFTYMKGVSGVKHFYVITTETSLAFKSQNMT